MPIVITYYDSPIPGFGVSFKDLILDQSYYLARRIEVSTIEEIQQRLTEVYLTMERPTLLQSAYIVHYFLILVAVIAFGCVAMAVIVLVGPICIPFFSVPRMERLFWGRPRDLAASRSAVRARAGRGRGELAWDSRASSWNSSLKTWPLPSGWIVGSPSG